MPVKSREEERWGGRPSDPACCLVSSWLWKACSREEPPRWAEISAPRRAPLRASLTSAPVGQTPANLTLKEDRASRYDYLTKFYRLEGILHPKMNIQASFYSPLCCSKPLLYHFLFDMETKRRILLVDIFLSWVGTEAYKLCEGCKKHHKSDPYKAMW